MPGNTEKRKSDFWKEREVRKEAGKGDAQRPTGATFMSNFDAVFSGENTSETKEETYGPLGSFAREKVTGSDGVSGPRYLVDPASLLDEIDRREDEIGTRRSSRDQWT